MQFNEVYWPLLQEFCLKIDKYYHKFNMPGLFLPNVMPDYFNGEKKYFYIGQDTYGWPDFNLLLNCYRNKDFTGYIRENNKWLTPEHIIEHSGNNAGSFWTMVIRLHIYLYTNNIIHVNQITNAEKQLLTNIGWGNLNSIELKGALQKNDFWDNVDKEAYYDIKECSTIFDKLKYVLDIYEPDIIFIFNWCNDHKTEQVTREITIHCDEKTYIQDIIATYTIEGYKTKLIWCPHPNKLKFHKKNINDLIEIIKGVL